MESKREGQSSFRQIDPIRAKVDMLIKQKLDKKHKDSIYRKKRHSMLVEYYDYDDDEEQKREAPINEEETQYKDNKLSFNAKIRKRGKNVSKIKFTLKIYNQKHSKFVKLIDISIGRRRQTDQVRRLREEEERKC